MDDFYAFQEQKPRVGINLTVDLTCSCSHLTPFFSDIANSITMLETSNLDLTLQISNLTFEDFKSKFIYSFTFYFFILIVTVSLFSLAVGRIVDQKDERGKKVEQQRIQILKAFYPPPTDREFAAERTKALMEIKNGLLDPG